MTVTDSRHAVLHLSPAAEEDVDDSRGLAQRLADMTDTARTFQHRAEHLAVALDSNRQIGVAVGLIMAQYKLGHQAAFDILVKLSQDSNRKIRDLAAAIIAEEDSEYQPVAMLAPMPVTEPFPTIHPDIRVSG